MRWVEPLGLLDGPAAFHAAREGAALPLAGGPAAFVLVRLIENGETRAVLPVQEVPQDWYEAVIRLTRRPAPYAGLPDDRPLVMGILNCTPDSFSDGGRYAGPVRAIAAGHAMLEQGADILDIGGESTRPGAEPVPPEEEARRVVPVIRELAKATMVSVDTRNALVMRAALEVGAEIVNDISALRHDPAALELVREARAPVMLMHMPGDDPRTMQKDPRYDDVALEVAQFLHDRVSTCEALGIPRNRIVVDPGIGFGKTVAHNLELLDRLPLLTGIGCRVLVGVSRKGFIGRIGSEPAPNRRAPGSIAAALAAAARGAAILRVHDVAETVQALAVWRACSRGGEAAHGEAG